MGGGGRGQRVRAFPSLISLQSDLYPIKTTPSEKDSNTCLRSAAVHFTENTFTFKIPTLELEISFWIHSYISKFKWTLGLKARAVSCVYSRQTDGSRERQWSHTLPAYWQLCPCPRYADETRRLWRCWRGTHSFSVTPPCPQRRNVIELWGGSSSRSRRICLGCKKKKSG